MLTIMLVTQQQNVQFRPCDLLLHWPRGLSSQGRVVPPGGTAVTTELRVRTATRPSGLQMPLSQQAKRGLLSWYCPGWGD